MRDPFRSQLLHRELDPVIGTELTFVFLTEIAEHLAHRHGGAVCFDHLEFAGLRGDLFPSQTETLAGASTELFRIIAGLDAEKFEEALRRGLSVGRETTDTDHRGKGRPIHGAATD